jgi:uncharacterized protein YcaQ
MRNALVHVPGSGKFTFMPDRPLPLITNAQARRFFLQKHRLSEPPIGTGRGADLLGLITDLGFVQVDSVNTLERAHHMILNARRQSYRSKSLKWLLERDRGLFEHWTHDAAVIPMAFFPRWRLKFKRDANTLSRRWKEWRREGFTEKFDTVLKQIADHGPVTSGDVGEGEERKSGGWWDWHPSKTALEYLWRSGELTVTRRNGFQKVYDLTERVVPPEHLNAAFTDEETIDWFCHGAMDRLGFATSGEIAAFWDVTTPNEAKNWCKAELGRGALIEVDIAYVGGKKRTVFARPDVVEQARAAKVASNRIRILSPFDPALRDRNRAERLFGFHYRIEIFVPEAKRKYGYYVFPVLEGDQLIGRIDMKALRAKDRLHIRAFWPEHGVRMGSGRRARLETTLERTARFAGVADISYAPDWLCMPMN